MSVFFLIDEYHDHYYDFVETKVNFPLTVVRPSRHYKRKQIAWIDGCYKVLKESSKKDIIIFTLDIQAIICSWICTLFFLNRKIVCINILLKDKKSFKNKIVSYLYKKALTRKNIIASVTSSEYGDWLNQKLGTNIEFVLQHDVFHDYYNKNSNSKSTKSIFCGGRNGRDWNFMLRVAKTLPDVTFNMVISTGVKDSLQETIPSNVIIHSNVNYDRFYQLMCESLMICLPLNTEAPAGLLVIFHAAANHKMVITTDNVVTREYIGNDRGVVIENDVQLWHNAIQYYLNNDDIREQRASNLLRFLRENCSEKQYVEGIELMVDHLNVVNGLKS